jgi:hypothetical protein
MSMTRRFVFFSRPESSVSRLCEMCNSSRDVRASRPVIVRKRFDWIDRIFKFVSVDKPVISVILFFPSHNSSRPVSVSRPLISRMRFAPSSIWRSWVSPSRFSIVLILFWTKYRSLSLVRWLRRLMVLILLKERSRETSSVKASRPLMWAIRLS